MRNEEQRENVASELIQVPQGSVREQRFLTRDPLEKNKANKFSFLFVHIE
jgi:hypothetical protein